VWRFSSPETLQDGLVLTDPPRLSATQEGYVRVADGQIPRPEGADQRAMTQVAVGVLIRSDGSFLLTTRPEGKAYAGYWEFPGGKVEPDESVEHALTRELREELGIDVIRCADWQTECIDYPHALVQLHFYKVFEWQGELQMREGQQFSWQCLPVQVSPVLPGTLPVLEWLAQAQSSISNSAFSVDA
jgi:8-oxo-dGTP diphosphatase